MTDQPLDIGEGAPSYTLENVRLLNFTLETDRIKYIFDPITDSISKNLEFSFKSPANIDFLSAIPAKDDQLFNCVQFDEICMRLFHLDSGKDFFVTFQSSFPRALIMRLLSTTLTEKSPNILFSSTEKGIFSFIMIRLLSEMKKALKERMPNIKFLGIFHSSDEALREFEIFRYGACNFMINFAATQFPVMVFCPTEMFEIPFDKPLPKELLFARCSHISKKLCFSVHRLVMSLETLSSLSFGDIILFDQCELRHHEQSLEGPLCAHWDRLTLKGELRSHDEFYEFVLDKEDFFSWEQNVMEEVEIGGSSPNLAQGPAKLVELAKNLRIEVTIEIGRISMSIKDICDLKAGEIITLHRTTKDPLDIVVDGKVIGTCMPVHIDGRLGVRIVSINEGQAPSLAA